MAAESSTELVNVVALLGAAVVAVPLFRRLGLGSVLGYFVAGLAIGPFGFGWFSEPQAILHVAELGVVMFLFVIGLEMRPSHLWSLRREIFGLGAAQIVTCMLVLSGVAWLCGFGPRVAFIAAAGFVLTSTAVVMQLLAERGDIALPSGQRIVSILLFEDLLIVPLLAVVAWMAPAQAGAHEGSRWASIAIGCGAIVGLILVGRYLLNPLFRILAAAKAREVMTAAALLVVLGAALLMQLGGLSMAMGAFLAGVLLSESTFRHQIEADIEPFRGILLGLFVLGVGSPPGRRRVCRGAARLLAGPRAGAGRATARRCAGVGAFVPGAQLHAGGEHWLGRAGCQLAGCAVVAVCGRYGVLRRQAGGAQPGRNAPCRPGCGLGAYGVGAGVGVGFQPSCRGVFLLMFLGSGAYL